jgi:Mismatch repair ATPase (MutS family)
MEGSERIDKSYLDYAGPRPLSHLVDDETAADLELDEVFKKIDRTLTTPGQSLLYALLRSSPATEAEWNRRVMRTRYYRERPELRAKLRRLLAKVGKQPPSGGDAAAMLFVDFPDFGLGKYRPLILAWITLVVASFFTPVFWGARAFFLVIAPLGIVNLVAYAKTTGQISAFTQALHYIGLMSAFCRRAKSKLSDALGDSGELARLAELYPQVRGVERPATFLKPRNSFGGDLSDAALMYLKVFLLAELASYLKVAAIVRGKNEALRSLYETLGELDAFCALAELEEEEDTGLALAELKTGERRIEATDATHPLVEDCVPVSFELDRGVVLTGTNMSGKSTFLRTLGINQVLATSLGIAYAGHFATDLFLVASSIRSEDNRAAGKSRYLAEAERLLSLIAAVRSGDPPVLALIDEILNGTNSQDRIAASIAILRSAAGRGSIVVAATHDLEIAQELQGLYAPYYFSEIVDDESFSFDYKLHEGIVDRKNALRILKLIGFGEEVLEPTAASAN